MGLYRSIADGEFRPDFFIAQPLGEQLNNTNLSSAQCVTADNGSQFRREKGWNAHLIASHPPNAIE
jgi:hypothetical protein